VHKLKPFISVISNSAESLTGMGIEITQRRNQPEYMALSGLFCKRRKTMLLHEEADFWQDSNKSVFHLVLQADWR